MHALDGGWFLQERHFPERVCQLVGITRRRFGLASADFLTGWSFVSAARSSSLDASPMRHDHQPRGLPVSFDGRIAEIIRRYPPMTLCIGPYSPVAAI